MVQRDLVIKGLAGSELAILADHAGLDRASADELDDTRNDPGMRKVYFLDTLMGLGQHLVLTQAHNREIRRKPRQNVGLKAA